VPLEQRVDPGGARTALEPFDGTAVLDEHERRRLVDRETLLLARHGSAGRKMKIPFGPFLALGGVVTLFAGDAILGAYLEVL